MEPGQGSVIVQFVLYHIKGGGRWARVPYVTRIGSPAVTSGSSWDWKLRYSGCKIRNGCVLCGDWTGGHQNHNCPYRISVMQDCRVREEAHMASLHGSKNKFAGMVHISNQVIKSKPKSKKSKPKSKASTMTLNYPVETLCTA